MWVGGVRQVPLRTTNGAEKQAFRGNKCEWPARTEAEAPLLEVKSVVPHSDLYELKGSAGPGRTVILNGDRVPIVFEKSSFRYFVGPLHDHHFNDPGPERAWRSQHRAIGGK